MTSTKKEMMAAFEELKQKIQEKAETELKPEKRKEEMRKEEVIKTADTLTTDGTVEKINALKVEIGKMLSQVSDKLEEEAANYLKLKESIELKKQGKSLYRQIESLNIEILESSYIHWIVSPFLFLPREKSFYRKICHRSPPPGHEG